MTHADDDGCPDTHDDGYAEFVAAMWCRKGVSLGRVVLQRGGTDCVMIGLVIDDRGRKYLNVAEAGVRKTYAADGRHRWFRHGEPVDASAFTAVALGHDPDKALRFEAPPADALTAVQPSNDRWPTTKRKFLLCYRNRRGETTFRIISELIRHGAEFTARCHFRWGDRRTFRKDCVEGILDLATGKVLSVANFL